MKYPDDLGELLEEAEQFYKLLQHTRRKLDAALTPGGECTTPVMVELSKLQIAGLLCLIDDLIGQPRCLDRTAKS